jgi:ketosteroid isomerase-like protein
MSISRAITLVALVVVTVAGSTTSAANDPKDERAIMATLEAMAEATIKKDFAALEKLYGDDTTYGHSGGNTETRDQMIASFKRPNRVAESMKFSEMTIRIYGDVALAKGITDFRNGTTGNLHDSHHNILWVLVKRPISPTGWQIVARQTTNLSRTNDNEPAAAGRGGRGQKPAPPAGQKPAQP